MQDSFDLLEDKVKKAADLVKKLRKENKSLDDQLRDNKTKLAAAEKRLTELETQMSASLGSAGQVEGLTAEVASLKSERQQVAARIAKIVSLLEALD